MRWSPSTISSPILPFLTDLANSFWLLLALASPVAADTIMVQISRVATGSLAGWWQARSGTHGRSVCQYWWAASRTAFWTCPNPQNRCARSVAMSRRHQGESQWYSIVVDNNYCCCVHIEYVVPLVVVPSILGSITMLSGLISIYGSLCIYRRHRRKCHSHSQRTR